MKILIIVISFFTLTTLKAQNNIRYTGIQFFAISVSSADSTSKWYEDVFAMTLLKEIKTADGNFHIRIIGNQFLKIEIIQDKASKSYTDCGVEQDQIYRVRGYFKTGFYVSSISEAEKYFRNKKVKIKHGPFDDKETNSRSLIIEDINGFLIQVMEEMK
jgi:hypothetical protein